MRTVRFSVFVAVVFALSAGVAVFAQGGGGRAGGRGMMAVTLAQVPAAAMQAPLELTADQRTRIEAIQTKLREDTRVPRGQGGGGGDLAAAMQRRQELNTKATQEIEALLTAAQKEKVPALLKQMQTFRTLSIPLEVVNDLKVTAEQMTKLEALAKDVQAKRQAAMAGGGGGGAMQQFQQMRQETRAKVFEILTADQKAIVEKWEKENPQQQRGGRRGGGQA